MLLVLLTALYPDAYLVFAFALGLDISSHWFHMYSTTMSGAHHKSTDAQKNFIMRLYYGSFYFFAYLCIGAELFYIFLYLQYFSTEMSPLAVSIVNYSLLAVAPGWALKQFVNVVQLGAAADACVAKDVASDKRSK